MRLHEFLNLMHKLAQFLVDIPLLRAGVPEWKTSCRDKRSAETKMPKVLMGQAWRGGSHSLACHMVTCLQYLTALYTSTKMEKVSWTP